MYRTLDLLDAYDRQTRQSIRRTDRSSSFIRVMPAISPDC
jgi:hypothetical protein